MDAWELGGKNHQEFRIGNKKRRKESQIFFHHDDDDDDDDDDDAKQFLPPKNEFFCLAKPGNSFHGYFSLGQPGRDTQLRCQEAFVKPAPKVWSVVRSKVLGYFFLDFYLEEPAKSVDRDIWICQLKIFQTPTLHGDFLTNIVSVYGFLRRDRALSLSSTLLKLGSIKSSQWVSEMICQLAGTWNFQPLKQLRKSHLSRKRDPFFGVPIPGVPILGLLFRGEERL